ncbi:MAG TPA: hypothetical protein PKW90_01525 [Myxococcota bacterium]|nr:hypothetical protein [Myxococcota bacterium]
MAEWRKLSGLEQSELKGHLEEICNKISGQSHSSQLTQDQARRVIELLQERVNAARPAPALAEVTPKAAPSSEPFVHWTQRGRPPVAPTPPATETPAAKPASRRDMISQAQQGTIAGLFELAGMSTREQQIGFSKRQCGLPWPQSKEHADKLIEGLKAICMRKVDHTEMERRVRALVGHKQLDAWKRNFVADLADQYSQAEDKTQVLTPHKLAKLMECEAAAK